MYYTGALVCGHSYQIIEDLDLLLQSLDVFPHCFQLLVLLLVLTDELLLLLSESVNLFLYCYFIKTGLWGLNYFLHYN